VLHCVGLQRMHMDGKICVIYVKNLFGTLLFSVFRILE
jgi:hypothetical protein